MGEQNFHLEILTPQELKFEGQATWVRLPSLLGEMGILANHTPLLAMLEPGVAVYRVLDRDHPLAVGEGFVRVAENRVVVLVESAERPEELESGAVTRTVEDLDRQWVTAAPAQRETLRLQRLLARARQRVADWG